MLAKLETPVTGGQRYYITRHGHERSSIGGVIESCINWTFDVSHKIMPYELINFFAFEEDTVIGQLKKSVAERKIEKLSSMAPMLTNAKPCRVVCRKKERNFCRASLTKLIDLC